MNFKYSPKIFDDTEDNGYLKNLFVNAYDKLEEGDTISFEIFRSKILVELKIMWKSGAISKNYADEIAEYLWGLI